MRRALRRIRYALGQSAVAGALVVGSDLLRTPTQGRSARRPPSALVVEADAALSTRTRYFRLGNVLLLARALFR